MELSLDYYAKFIIGHDIMVHQFKNEVLENAAINHTKINESTILITFKVKQMDIYNISYVKEILDTMYKNTTEENKRGFNIIIDCDSITYIDSSVVGALLNAWQQLYKIKKSLILYNVNNVIKQTLKNLNLNTFFIIFNTLEESVQCLKEKS